MWCEEILILGTRQASWHVFNIPNHIAERNTKCLLLNYEAKWQLALTLIIPALAGRVPTRSGHTLVTVRKKSECEQWATAVGIETGEMS
jgi:hypothetical protein